MSKIKTFLYRLVPALAAVAAFVVLPASWRW